MLAFSGLRGLGACIAAQLADRQVILFVIFISIFVGFARRSHFSVFTPGHVEEMSNIQVYLKKKKEKRKKESVRSLHNLRLNLGPSRDVDVLRKYVRR